MFKIIYRLPEGSFKRVLRRVRLYHPPLHRLHDLSEGSAESLIVRSEEFSEILSDVIINSVWKRTWPSRIKVLDKWVLPFIQEPISNSFAMLDVGGSDGGTTYSTINYFRDNLGVEIKATVLEKELRLHSFRWGCLRYYLTHDENPLLLQIGLLGILLEETVAKEGFIFNPIVRVLKKYLRRWCIEKGMKDCGDILLENPLVRNDPDIDWLEQDLFLFNPALIKAFDFIRCCNVLNLGYFSEPQISEALQLLTRYLKPKGILLVSRTNEDAKGSLHNASLWMNNDGYLKHSTDLNGGSEVKKLVLISFKE